MARRTEDYYQHIQGQNLEEYKKEERMALSIAEKIPSTPAEQDRRSKNRFREHAVEGCRLLDTGRTSHHQPNHTLHQCACGWIGWLIPKDDT